MVFKNELWGLILMLRLKWTHLALGNKTQNANKCINNPNKAATIVCIFNIVQKPAYVDMGMDIQMRAQLKVCEQASPKNTWLPSPWSMMDMECRTYLNFCCG